MVWEDIYDIWIQKGLMFWIYKELLLINKIRQKTKYKIRQNSQNHFITEDIQMTKKWGERKDAQLLYYLENANSYHSEDVFGFSRDETSPPKSLPLIKTKNARQNTEDWKVNKSRRNKKRSQNLEKWLTKEWISLFLFLYAYSQVAVERHQCEQLILRRCIFLARGTKKRGLWSKECREEISFWSLFSCTLALRVDPSYRYAILWEHRWLKLWDKLQFSDQTNQESDPWEPESMGIIPERNSWKKRFPNSP